ncbi:probable RNA-binding protein 46 [Diachasma alloeum]|uniref:probable RNA-binding protein 46 n=1 Tax=Diachasma alloeum TaxID=454923 RepID=UPI0007384B1E|nr:probable RNA-binding protein 46 [Diachasma alloeum]
MNKRVVEESLDEECRVTARLLDLMNQTHYELIQENGQRRLTAPELTSDLRSTIKGGEVFVGRLPRDCYEDEIMPVLDRAGRLLELRLMLDFSGTTRGYAFALFENSRVARRACELLDGHEIRPGHRIGVVKSIDNCRLFFGGVPKDKTKAEFAEELGKFLEGISDIYLYPNAQDRTQNRGFIFVEFKDHRSAAMARRQLIPGRVTLWDHEVAVDWADPEPGDPVDEDVMETVTALFVRNLPLETAHHKIRDIFQKTTGIPILKFKKINHFAFIHYETRELAQKVLEIMSKPGGIAAQNEWEIRWAKPISSSKILERQRSIHEAVQASLNQNFKPPAYVPPKSSSKRGKKKTNKQQVETPPCEIRHTSQEVDNTFPTIESPRSVPGLSPPELTIPNHNLLDFKKLLEDFVSRNFGAHCQFRCMQVYTPPGYVCTVLIVHEEHILYEFQGDVMITEGLAINITARNAYYRLSSDFGELPAYPIPVYPPTAYQPSRAQPCH